MRHGDLTGSRGISAAGCGTHSLRSLGQSSPALETPHTPVSVGGGQALLTETLQDGLALGRVRVCNPFA